MPHISQRRTTAALWTSSVPGAEPRARTAAARYGAGSRDTCPKCSRPARQAAAMRSSGMWADICCRGTHETAGALESRVHLRMPFLGGQRCKGDPTQTGARTATASHAGRGAASHLACPDHQASPEGVQLSRNLLRPRSALHRLQSGIQRKPQRTRGSLSGHSACRAHSTGRIVLTLQPPGRTVSVVRVWVPPATGFTHHQRQPRHPSSAANPLHPTLFSRFHQRVQRPLLQHVHHVHLQLHGRGCCVRQRFDKAGWHGDAAGFATRST